MAPVAQYMLSAEGISKSFKLKDGQTLSALDSVSFNVRAGGSTALVGPDGAGKSTLLRILAGLLRADSGKLVFDGGEPGGGTGITTKGEELQEQIGYMPQKFGLYEDLTVQENLDLYADLKGVSLPEREARYSELLAMSAMEPFRKRLAGKLSGGMKQKLGLICTLVSPPKLLLLDEPTVGVDPLSRRELWEIVERLTKGGTGGEGSVGMSVVVSTSYLDEAARCDEVVLLFEGKPLARGTPEAIRKKTEGMGYLAKPAAGETPRALQARLLGASGIIDAVPQGGSVHFIHGALTDAQKVQLNTQLRGAIVSKSTASLEDSFMLLLRSHLQTPQQVAGQVMEQVVERTAEQLSLHNTVPFAGSGVVNSAGQVQTSELTSAQAAENAGAFSTLLVTPVANVSSIINDAGAHNSNTTYKSKGEPIIETKNVSRLFGDFIAVNNVSFSVYQGEVFGLLGPNGAGKTTTFRMLCGLLPASSGSLHVAGVDVREARLEARRHLGYVAQKFSLYGPLSVRENLEFFAGAYGLRGQHKNRRIQEVVAEFSLERQLQMTAESLPGGYKQRLAMAVGLLHEPEILFLDEPTSGADPLARRDFWKRISRLAEQGVTIVVTTHFMEEAEYCDRILIQDSGIMLALGTPEEIRIKPAPSADTSGAGSSASAAMPTIEDAFIDIVRTARIAAKPQASPATNQGTGQSANPAANPAAKQDAS